MILSVPVTASNLPSWVRAVANAVNQLIAKRVNIVSKDAAYTITEGDDVVLGDATSAAFSVTLPPAAQYTGRTFIVKKIDSSGNAVTIDGNASEEIDGATTVALSTQYESRTLLAGSTSWHII
jgi:hypothetical protein